MVRKTQRHAAAAATGNLHRQLVAPAKSSELVTLHKSSGAWFLQLFAILHRQLVAPAELAAAELAGKPVAPAVACELVAPAEASKGDGANPGGDPAGCPPGCPPLACPPLPAEGSVYDINYDAAGGCWQVRLAQASCRKQININMHQYITGLSVHHGEYWL